MTVEQRAARNLEAALRHPYARGFDPVDAADRAALGVCEELCDRSGLDDLLGNLDDETRHDMVMAFAAVIRAAYAAPKAAGG